MMQGGGASRITKQHEKAVFADLNRA